MTCTSTETAALRCSLARNSEDMDAVFRLRYLCYHRRGAIADRDDARFRDALDDCPNQFSFLVRDAAAEALATVRISVVRPDLGWHVSPAEKVFGDHPAFQAIAAGTFVEASRLCFAQTARRDAFYGLLGNMAALGQHFKVEWLTACPRVEHSEIYQRLYGFTPLAPPRRYFGVSFETELLGIRLDALRERASRNRWMRRAWDDAHGRLAVIQYF